MTASSNILITGTGSLIGQAIIKSILRSKNLPKLNLIGCDYFTNTVGSFWCSKNYLLPDILKTEITEEEWLKKIIEIVTENSIKLIFVGVDFELILFAKYKLKIEKETNAIVLVSEEEVINIADDKYLTYEFLKKNSFYYPESFLPNEAINLKYPVIVKPRNGARSVGVYKVENKESLEAIINKTKDPIIQELVGTAMDEYTCGVIFLDNQVKESIVLKRSLKEGNTFISDFKFDFPNEIKNYVESVAMKLKPFGSCNFQLRVDKNGIPKIFEINARHSGTTYIRSLFGFNEVEYIINYLLENKTNTFNLNEGKVVRYFDEFFMEK